ncbi:zinc finger BED domain-containing protein RICESLEEPER 2 [Tanacetum coccineum]
MMNTNKDDDNNKKHDNKKNGNKRKRKPGGGIGNKTADCWKYFDPKMERPDGPDGPDGPLVKMAHFCDFLEKFKEKTELVSTQSSPVAHLFYSEILDVDKHLREWEVVPKFKLMVEKMRLKYDKYWGDYKNINHYMYFAVLLDPTMKSEILGYGFRHLMENGCITESEEYEEKYTIWMKNDILSIQISTVAFESAFSTSGRVLDLYRNALSPQIVESLLCTQSWVRTSQKNIYMDDLEDLMKDEEVIKEMKEALDKLKGATGNISLEEKNVV